MLRINWNRKRRRLLEPPGVVFFRGYGRIFSLDFTDKNTSKLLLLGMLHMTSQFPDFFGGGWKGAVCQSCALSVRHKCPTIDCHLTPLTNRDYLQTSPTFFQSRQESFVPKCRLSRAPLSAVLAVINNISLSSFSVSKSLTVYFQGVTPGRAVKFSLCKSLTRLLLK